MSEKTGKPLNYRAYLLRLWQVNDGQQDWRASLESAHDAERRGFADLETLFSFLRQQTSTGSGHHPEREDCANQIEACRDDRREGEDDE